MGGVKVKNRDQLSPAEAETGAELGNKAAVVCHSTNILKPISPQ